MKSLTPTLLCDFYKISHREQYPKGTEVVYSTWTPRSMKYLDVKKIVVFGIQGFLQELHENFEDGFFNKTKGEVIAEYKVVIQECLFVTDPDTSHIEALHDLGHLPILVKALEEGSKITEKIPMLTIENTDPRFFWFTNYIETMASATLWKSCTSASIAYEYRKILDSFARQTTGSVAGVEFQGHDFSMRGMSGVEDAARTGAGHLLSFVGTDTIPAIQYLRSYYDANFQDGLIGCSVNATEHSVMCAAGKDDEFETYRRLIEDIYPKGIVSIVSDTWDLWKVLTETLPKLKGKILARDSGIPEVLDKVVIRPDSGDPRLILCGDPEAALRDPNSPEAKGVIQLLWDTFGGTVNEQGFKVLNPKVGAIYGDAITLQRCTDICQNLVDNGFATTNVVFGIGSYTYQYVTRDSLGFAMKATSVTIDGVERDIFKDPITDSGVKKSAKGRVKVIKDTFGRHAVLDSDTDKETFKDAQCELRTVYQNGNFVDRTTLTRIREKLK